MKTTVTMPALSPTMEEGALRKWLVKVGDRVRPGDILAEIETDKATMEVEAVEEGVVVRLLVPEGSEGVKVNSVIAELESEGPQSAATASPPPAVPAPPPSPAAMRTDPAPAAVSRTASAHRPSHDRRLRASPLARRLAAERGIDLAGISGSGPSGRIVRADIDALPSRAAGGPGPAPSVSLPASTPAGFSLIEPATLDDRVYPPGSYDLVPLDGVRRIAARRLTQSFMQVPHFPLTVDLEIDRLLAARRAMNETMSDGGKISVNDMLIKAAALSLMAEPDANASFTDKGIARHKSAHVSMAVAIEGGLITPVIRDAQTKGLAQIASETRDLAARARARKLNPQEYMGGTFSISNLGMFGIRSFSSIINPPEGMILSVGEGSLRPVVRNGELVAATVMTVTLTCDHRVVDGAVGARWLQHFRQFVETPEAMLL
ncbi:MAG: pyruvate dehydrogenase complex dihydrolipoamide acetyltransferase [Alphaproteobacteria bacterium]|nr:pyruvate dehydrogenase complex dihydrolipoamide acetyltransferase [Alphaproteobacteria bacterium]